MTEPFIPRVTAPDDADGQGPAHWWVVRAGEVLVHDSGDVPYGELPVAGATERPIIMGSFGDVLAWAVGVSPDAEAPAGTSYVPLRALSGQMEEERWALAGRAVQLVEWARTSRYCGRCGAATAVSPGERGMRCSACGLVAYPRVAPAIITLVERGDEVLLANGRLFGGPMYSCLAGFVEPGETLEATVRREVREEVGVALDEVRYFASQSWPFPHSLMIGFLAKWADGDIVIDDSEIVDAQWFRAEAMPMIPPRMSIARSLIDDWLRRQGVEV